MLARGSFLVNIKEKGESSIRRWLETNTLVVKRSMVGVHSPTTVTCKQHKQIGGNTPTDGDKVIKYQKSNGSRATYSSAVSIDATTEYVDFFLYDRTKIIDRVRVQVILDAEGIEPGSKNHIVKPTSYKKNDTWWLENDTVHTPDKEGTIMIATSDSSTYVASHWVDKSKYVGLGDIKISAVNLIPGSNKTLTASNPNHWRQFGFTEELTAGKMYIITAETFAQNGGAYFFSNGADNGVIQNFQWGVPFTALEGIKALRFGNFAVAGNYVTIGRPMLVEGTIVAPWDLAISEKRISAVNLVPGSNKTLTASNPNHWRQFGFTEELTAGKMYIITAETFAQNGGAYFFSNGVDNGVIQNFQWGVPFTALEGIKALRFGNFAVAGNYVTIGRPMLGEGSVSAGWSKAPKDIQAEIAAVNTKAEANITRLNNFASDGLISPMEKTALRSELISETDAAATIVIEGVRYSVSSTAFVAKWNLFKAQLTRVTAATPENIAVGTLVATQSAYYDAKLVIVNALSVAVKKVGDDAQAGVNTLDYLKEALKGKAIVNTAGLVLSEIMAVVSEVITDDATAKIKAFMTGLLDDGMAIGAHTHNAYNICKAYRDWIAGGKVGTAPTRPNFLLDDTGRVYMKNADIEGVIHATDGIFKGRVEANSGNFGNTEIDPIGNLISGDDDNGYMLSSGVLRFNRRVSPNGGIANVAIGGFGIESLTYATLDTEDSESSIPYYISMINCINTTPIDITMPTDGVQSGRSIRIIRMNASVTIRSTAGIVQSGLTQPSYVKHINIQFDIVELIWTGTYWVWTTARL